MIKTVFLMITAAVWIEENACQLNQLSCCKKDILSKDHCNGQSFVALKSDSPTFSVKCYNGFSVRECLGVNSLSRLNLCFRQIPSFYHDRSSKNITCPDITTQTLSASRASSATSAPCPTTPTLSIRDSEVLDRSEEEIVSASGGSITPDKCKELRKKQVCLSHGILAVIYLGVAFLFGIIIAIIWVARIVSNVPQDDNYVSLSLRDKFRTKTYYVKNYITNRTGDIGIVNQNYKTMVRNTVRRPNTMEGVEDDYMNTTAPPPYQQGHISTVSKDSIPSSGYPGGTPMTSFGRGRKNDGYVNQQ